MNTTIAYAWYENKKFVTFKNSRGFRKTPTPLGVPVRITSPGSSVNNLENKNENKNHQFRNSAIEIDVL